MRTTIDVNEGLLRRAKELTGSKTMREAVNRSLEETVRHREIQALRGMFGKVRLRWNLKEFLEFRRRG